MQIASLDVTCTYFAFFRVNESSSKNCMSYERASFRRDILILWHRESQVIWTSQLLRYLNIKNSTCNPAAPLWTWIFSTFFLLVRPAFLYLIIITQWLNFGDVKKRNVRVTENVLAETTIIFVLFFFLKKICPYLIPHYWKQYTERQNVIWNFKYVISRIIGGRIVTRFSGLKSKSS